MEREALKLALEALEKLADATPTTHVRAGKASIEGKEHVALWFDNCADPFQQATYINKTKPEKIKLLITAIKEALAQPAQEPVACARCKDLEEQAYDLLGQLKAANLKWSVAHPQPPQRPWVGLTEEEIKEIVGPYGDMPIKGYTRKLFDQIEAKLRSKNT